MRATSSGERRKMPPLISHPLASVSAACRCAYLQTRAGTTAIIFQTFVPILLKQQDLFCNALRRDSMALYPAEGKVLRPQAEAARMRSCRSQPVVLCWMHMRIWRLQNVLCKPVYRYSPLYRSQPVISKFSGLLHLYWQYYCPAIIVVFSWAACVANKLCGWRLPVCFASAGVIATIIL